MVMIIIISVASTCRTTCSQRTACDGPRKNTTSISIQCCDGFALPIDSSDMDNKIDTSFRSPSDDFRQGHRSGSMHPKIESSDRSESRNSESESGSGEESSDVHRKGDRSGRGHMPVWRSGRRSTSMYLESESIDSSESRNLLEVESGSGSEEESSDGRSKGSNGHSKGSDGRSKGSDGRRNGDGPRRGQGPGRRIGSRSNDLSESSRSEEESIDVSSRSPFFIEGCPIGE